MREVSPIEELIAIRLRPLLSKTPVGSAIEPTEDFRWVLSCLEYFVPEVLGEIHEEWNRYTLDGICPAIARMTGPDEIEIIGLCLFLTSPCLMVPAHIQLQLAANENVVCWCDCRVGESCGDGMLKIPYSRRAVRGDALHGIPARLDRIDWAYHVGYGSRRTTAQ